MALQRPDDPAEHDNVQYLLDRAERLLRQTLLSRNYDFDVLANDPAKSQYMHDMIVDAVARVLRNPGAAAGFKSESEGNYSYSISSALEASATLWFPDTALDLLIPKRVGKYGTIRLSRPARDW